MTQNAVIFQKLTFTYESMSTDLFAGVDVHLPMGWTGIIGANGAGKSTLLKLATGIITPDQGTIISPGNAYYCAQRTDDSPDDLSTLIQAGSRQASAARALLDIREEWAERWDTLSHGERKRLQIAVALWKEPFVLALDEPTNHVDTTARRIILQALKRFRGIGLLVSHDRELLDGLCNRFLFVRPPGVIMRDGTVDEGLKQEQREIELAARHYDETQKQLEKIKSVAAGHRREASRADKKRSKKGISAKDHDAKSKKDLARMSGKDGQSGRLLKQQEGKIRQMQKRLDDIAVVKQYEMGVWQDGSRSRKDSVLNMESCRLHLGEDRSLQIPSLIIRPEDHIGLVGPNGTGKSTLIRQIVRSISISEDQLIYLPQEIDESRSRSIIQEVRDLPGEQLGHLMTIVNRLGTRPPRLLETDIPSPGEIRKTLLALGIVRSPHLIIMDEPTNHLDLPSINCMEEMLSECPCALLLVSHDLPFLDKLVTTRWEISPTDRQPDCYELSVD